jgi:hypothetical protein
MDTHQIHINFSKIALALSKIVREKAIISGSKIIYIKDDNLVEEEPLTGSVTIISKNTSTKRKWLFFIFLPGRMGLGKQLSTRQF